MTGHPEFKSDMTTRLGNLHYKFLLLNLIPVLPLTILVPQVVAELIVDSCFWRQVDDHVLAFHEQLLRAHLLHERHLQHQGDDLRQGLVSRMKSTNIYSDAI